MLCIISKNTLDTNSFRDIQMNSLWESNSNSDYAIVPESMIQGVLATGGYCDITLNAEGTEIVSFVAKDPPDPEFGDLMGDGENTASVKIASGEYIGNGAYGSNNKNSLTFPFVPKVIFISCADNNESSFHAPMPIIYDCATARINFRVDASSDRCYSDCIYLTWSGETMQWYSSNTTYKSRTQLNDIGVTYNWVAIG